MTRSVTIGLGVALAVSLARGQAPPGAKATAPAPTPAPAAAPAPPSGPAPHLKFAATVLNLGDVVRGQDAVAEFVYTNTGDAPLKILSAKPG